MEITGAGSAPESPLRITKSRRNGKLYSCEPCRRNKLKCDHTLPVCGRCVRRKKPQACIYHPAPLTKPRGPENSNGSASSPVVEASHPPRPPTNDGIRSPDPPLPYVPPTTATPFNERKLGFLGPTSFFSVFNDDHQVSNIPPSSQEGREASTPILDSKVLAGTEPLSILTQHNVILRRFLLRKYITLHCGVLHEPTLLGWIEDIFSMIDRLDITSQDSLNTWSRMIWQSTSTPVRIGPQTSMRQWAQDCSGQKLRWEVLGLFFTIAGLCAHDADDWYEHFHGLPETVFIERSAFLDRIHRAAEACLRFCSECEHVNELYIIFQLKLIVLVEDLYGDTHSIAWRRVGDIASTVVGAGMHRPDKLPPTTPVWQREVRRRILLNAYSRDQSQSAFFGRPPRLSYTYCKLEVPLDLAEEELLLEGVDLQRALASLDSDGWSTKERPGITIAYHLRLSIRISMLREDISKLALGLESNEQVADRMDDMVGRFEDLHSRINMVEHRPQNVASRAANTSTKQDGSYDTTRDDIARLTRCHVRVSTLHAEFLFVKALVNRGLRQPSDLIPLAVKLLEHIIGQLSDSAVFLNYKSELSYLLLTYGLPSSGIVALELLKQQRSGATPSPAFSRSEAIQNLSVFVAALGAIEPRQGNYAVCDQGRKLLRSMLDQILNGPVTTSTAPPNDHSTDFPLLNDVDLLQLSTDNDVDFWQWLETSEWIKDL